MDQRRTDSELDTENEFCGPVSKRRESSLKNMETVSNETEVV